MYVYFIVKKVCSLTKKKYMLMLKCIVFTSEENLFTCEEKRKFSCIDVHVFTSEKKVYSHVRKKKYAYIFLFTREEKMYVY